MTVLPRVTLESGDIDAALAEFFLACRPRVLESFRLAEEEGARSVDDSHIDESWACYNLTAIKLIRASIELADRLQGRRHESTHRIVVERVTMPAADLPPAEALDTAVTLAR